jgi:hypothetical protein
MSSIKQYLPTILIEVLDEIIASRLNEQFKDTPYSYFNLNEATGEIKKMHELGKSNDYNVLICTPKVAGELGLE